ncbi:MAG: PKD domain-containing protein, partial [Chitinophagaceae bacterium]
PRLDNLTLRNPFSCIVNPPAVCYEVGYFITNITLPDNVEGYTIAYETCCRINGISNASDGAGQSPGATYAANIPGTRRLGNNSNTSPVFNVKDTALVCRGKNFILDFSATDADGDSLSYSFCNAFQSGGPRDANARLPQQPPYGSLFYLSPYSGTSPLGSDVRINPATGLISGRAPSGGIVNVSGASFFVVNVCVDEWRNGVIISQHRKDFIVRVGSCDFAEAELPISITNCDGYTNNFENLTTSSLIKTWNWSFGDGNTSTDATPQHTYADTGTYRVQLIVNKDSVCSDTAETLLRVYPGFRPGFEVRDGCQNRPIQFTDTSNTSFGNINYRKWD